MGTRINKYTYIDAATLDTTQLTSKEEESIEVGQVRNACLKRKGEGCGFFRRSGASCEPGEEGCSPCVRRIKTDAGLFIEERDKSWRRLA